MSFSFVQLVGKWLFEGPLLHEILDSGFLGVQLFRDFTFKDFAENSGEFSNTFVEEREKLIRLKVQVYLQVLHWFVLQAQTQQERWLCIGERHCSPR